MRSPAAGPPGEELYVGWRKRSPSQVARRSGAAAAAGLLVALLVAALLLAAQRPFPAGSFELGVVRELAGTVRLDPYPLLDVRRPGSAPGETPAFSTYLLVSPGKHGADDAVAGFADRSVRLSGTLIHRPGATMVEVVPGSLAAAGTPAVPAPEWEDAGEVELVGELVDGKCHFGVMKPGRGTVHRACAVNCVGGGIPPLFRSAGGEADSRAPAWALVVDPRGGRAGRAVLPLLGRPVAAPGRLWRRGALALLAVDPAAIEPWRDRGSAR